ncbi:hypothetical protein CK203_101425 [Vitis vinifera]|uniref:Uncharacterized protein n=1 Tax=Vitis vinifera TaxID=29760 RepID=A0A438FGX5_VITVI|nr:hypothetical protein CK203_101425 [Vitis vinifera]
MWTINRVSSPSNRPSPMTPQACFKTGNPARTAANGPVWTAWDAETSIRLHRIQPAFRPDPSKYRKLGSIQCDEPRGKSVLLMAKFPCYSSRHQQRNPDQRVIVNPPSSCKKDVRMGCPDTPSDD